MLDAEVGTFFHNFFLAFIKNSEDIQFIAFL